MNQSKKHSYSLSASIFILGFIVGFITHSLSKVSPEPYYVPPVQAQLQTKNQQSPCAIGINNVDEIHIKVNELRLSHGKKQLLVDQSLMQYADLRAKELAKNQVLSHESKYTDVFYWSRDTKTLLPPSMTQYGEDINGRSATACIAIDAFAKSPTHLDSLTDSIFINAGFAEESGYYVIILGN